MTVAECQLFESTRAAARLEVAERFLRSLPQRSPVLIVAPSPAAALWLVHRVLDAGQARVGWQRRTLDMLAHELALPRLVAGDRVAVRGLGCEALCARVIQDAGEAGELGRYASLRARPGFARALANAVEELRLAGISAEALAPHDAALGRLFARYEMGLAAAQLADRAEVFAMACEGTRAVGADVPLLALDTLLPSLAHTRFAAALCRGRTQVCVVHPAGDARSRSHWRAALGDRGRNTSETSAPLPARTDLERLQTHLFELHTERELPPFERGHVQVLSSPGESREAVEMVRGVLAAAARGVPFDRMAVVLRAVESYRAVVEEALTRAHVPAHFADGVRRPAPEGRALLALLRCAQQGLSARAFAEYLSLSVTPKAELDGESGGVSPRHWERLLIDSAVIGGRDRWQRRLAGRTNALRSELDALDADDPQRLRTQHDIDRLDALSTFALPILDALSALPEGGSWGQWLDALDALARQALRAPAGVCETLAELAPLAPLAPVGLREVLRVLRWRLRSVLSRSSGSGAGSVFVGAVEDVLGRSFEQVFVLGLAEKIFPPRIEPDPLLPDRLRAAVGPALLQPDERVAQERLAMRVCVGAASGRAVLSYPRFDVEHNRARVPSFYGLEALRAIEGTLPAFDELARRADAGAAARLGWPAPEAPEQAIDEAEYDLAMLARLRSRPAERAGSARYFLSANVHLARALRFRARRWNVSRFLPTDGLVLTAESLPLLAAHQLDARSYSATALAQFAACPYRFYLHAIAGVSARDEALELDELDARQRGVLFHSAQRALLESLRARNWLPLPAGQLDAALQLLEEIFTQLACDAREAYAPAIGRVFDTALQTTRADLQQWLMRLPAERGWQPLHVEFGFGSARPELDRDSRREPVQLEGGLSLRGAIDVVERRLSGVADDPPVLRATDHKTGPLPDKLGTLSGGRLLQPALYALALERLFPEARVESGRLYFCTSRGGFLSHEVPLDPATRAAYSRLTGAIDTMLRAGFLPAAPHDDECERCAYQTVCGPYEAERVARVKTRSEELERLSPLFRLRVTP